MPFCSICLSPFGPFSLEPLGKDDAMVAVCRACADEHPRAGRYSFEGGKPTEFPQARTSGRDGNGNASTRAKAGR